jgi:hypothetical protein
MPIPQTIITTRAHKTFLQTVLDLARALTTPDSSRDFRQAGLDFETEFQERLKEAPSFEQETPPNT